MQFIKSSSVIWSVNLSPCLSACVNILFAPPCEREHTDCFPAPLLLVLASLWNLNSLSPLSLHSWYAKYRHCERCAVGIQRSSRLSKQYTQTLCVPTSPPYTRSCSDQTLSSPCPLTGSSPARCQCAHRRGMWRRNLRHFIGALHKKMERTDGTLFNFFYIRGEGLGSWFSRFTLLNFFGRRVGPDTPWAVKRRRGIKNICTVELDHLWRISSMEP